MIRVLLAALVATGLFLAGCSQEQKTAPTQPKAALEPAAPAIPAAPLAPATPVPPAEPAKPAAPAEPAKPAAPAAAAKPGTAAKPPQVADTLILEASQGKVTLPHLMHAKLFPCATCHGEATPGKITLDKDTAHALCRECHQTKGMGPTACGGCHKK
jgi:nucleoid-associated protein YgaU